MYSKDVSSLYLSWFLRTDTKTKAKPPPWVPLVDTSACSRGGINNLLSLSQGQPEGIMCPVCMCQRSVSSELMIKDQEREGFCCFQWVQMGPDIKFTKTDMENNGKTQDKCNRVLYRACYAELLWALVLFFHCPAGLTWCFLKSPCKGIGIAGGPPLLEPCLIKSLRKDSVWFNEMVVRRSQNQHCMKCVCPADASNRSLQYWTHLLPLHPTWPSSPPTCLPLVSSPPPMAILPRIIAAGLRLASKDQPGPLFPFTSPRCWQLQP